MQSIYICGKNLYMKRKLENKAKVNNYLMQKDIKKPIHIPINLKNCQEIKSRKTFSLYPKFQNNKNFHSSNSKILNKHCKKNFVINKLKVTNKKSKNFYKMCVFIFTNNKIFYATIKQLYLHIF